MAKARKSAVPKAAESPEPMTRSDLRLAARALREQWPMPLGRLEKLLESVVDLVEAPSTKPRERVGGLKVLLQAARLNLDAVTVAAGADYSDVMAELRALRGELGCAQLGSGAAGAPPLVGFAGADGGSGVDV